MSGVEAIPGFDFPSGYTAFQFAFVMLQASAFGGVFAGFSIAADFESGFTRRLMLASPDRRGILVGYAVAALFRAVVVWVMLIVVALLAGMRIDGGPVDLVGLYTLAALVNVTGLMFSAGVAIYRSGWSYEQWVDSADQALYVAKRSGRNRVRAAGPAAVTNADEAGGSGAL